MILAKRADLERLITRGPGSLRGLVLHGRDRSVVREFADRMAQRVTPRMDDPFEVARLDESDLEQDPGRLSDELAALALTGGPRLVRLRLSADKAGLDRRVALVVNAHLAGELNAKAFLLVESEALERGSALRKAAEAGDDFGCAAIYDDEPAELAQLVRTALEADAIRLDPRALEMFVARLPHARGVARQEIERLVLFLGPGRVAAAGVEDLEAFVGGEPEANLFQAASDAFGGRVADAQAGWRRAKAEGETGPAVIRSLSSHLSRLRRAASLVAAGRGAADAAKACGVFWKQEREFLRQLGAWRTAELDVVQPELLEADRACKSAGAPDGLIAERVVMMIGARARRLGL